MANEKKRKQSRKTGRRRTESYEPVRLPRLRGPAAEPPPLPVRPPAAREPGDAALFGEAAEDGLRMLAALETIDSLEPDFADDPAGEASVTIIERSSFDAVEPRETPPPLERAAKRRRGVAPDDRPEAPYFGPADEAEVEIFEVPSPAPAPAGPRRQKKRSVPQRFFKALTGGDGG